MNMTRIHRFFPALVLVCIAGRALAGGIAWVDTGNNPASNNILGSLTNVPVNITSNSQTILQVSHSSAVDGANTYLGGNLIGGYWANTVNGSQCIVLGGFSFNGAPHANFAHDLACTVLGGGDNAAGINDSNTFNQGYATVCGGAGNEARGAYATVIGGFQNEARGVGASNIGGAFNQAGGDYSTAGGYHAVVRSAATVGDSNGDQGSFVWSDASSVSSFTSSADNQFLVRATGGVGLGTNAPHGQLEVSSAGTFARPQLVINETTTSFSRIAFTNSQTARFWHFSGNANGATSNDDRLNFYHSSGRNVMQMTGDGRVGIGGPAPVGSFTLDVFGAIRCTSLTQTSSGRYKTDVQPVDGVLERFMQLRPVSFTWDAAHGGERDLGLIAEDVASVFPEAVACENGEVEGINYSRLTALAIQALKEQHEKAAAGSAKVEKLEAENKDLRARLDAIEQRLNAR